MFERLAGMPTDAIYFALMFVYQRRLNLAALFVKLMSLQFSFEIVGGCPIDHDLGMYNRKPTDEKLKLH